MGPASKQSLATNLTILGTRFWFDTANCLRSFFEFGGVFYALWAPRYQDFRRTWTCQHGPPNPLRHIYVSTTGKTGGRWIWVLWNRKSHFNGGRVLLGGVSLYGRLGLEGLGGWLCLCVLLLFSGKNRGWLAGSAATVFG